MEALLKKHFWVIQAIGVAAAVGLAASAIMTQIGARFVLDVGASDDNGDEEDDEDEDEKAGRELADKIARGRSKSRSSNATAKNRIAGDIQKYNIFCPTCVPVDGAAVAAVDGEGRPIGIQPGEIKSNLPLKLMATMEAENPEHSFATVYDTEDGGAGLYGIGDKIRPTVTVVGVDLGILHMRNNAQLEYLQLGDENAAPKKRSSSKDKKDDKKKDDKKKKDSRSIDGAEDAINCPNENTCTVDRAFVEKLMTNPALLAKQARIVPSQKNGETQGFKFYGIRRGSLPKLLGIRNGDMITEINGEELKSVDKAMGLYTKLRRASNLTVTLKRKGKSMTKEIQIQ